MRWWDESIFAVNTYEMANNGNYFALFFNELPDLYNTKLPLTNWLQLIFVKIIGYNELAIRLPSAICSAITVLLIFRFISKHYNLLFAWISTLILLTSFGFIGFHTSRTGDSDAILTLFLTLANLFFINYLINEKKRNILLFFVFITLSFVTKLYASFLFIPAYFIVLIYYRKVKDFCLNFHFISGVLVFICTTATLIYLRNIDNPGYFKKILVSDAGRLFNELDTYRESLFFYFDNLFNYQFSLWVVFLVLGFLYVFFSKQKEVRILKIISIFIFVYLFIISFSDFKRFWYTMPLFPFLSVIAAYPIYELTNQFKFNNIKKIVFVLILFLYPFLLSFYRSQKNTISLGDRKIEAVELYLFNAIKLKQPLSNTKVFFYGWKGSLLFYKYKLKESGVSIKLIQNSKFIYKNDKILVANDSLKKFLINNFDVEIINNRESAFLYQIKGVK